jgi:PAS domain S-box-containing protein
MSNKVSFMIYKTSIFFVLVLPVLYFISRYNYNLFHSFADGVSIVIAACVFTIIWNARRIIDNDYFLYVGIAFLFFAFMDLMHLLGNKGMGVFPEYGNLGPTLYIATRYVLSISLMIAPLFINRKLNTTVMFAVYSLVTLSILLSIFYWQIFPVCIVEGGGLTSFKVVSDYVICLILLGAIGLLLLNRRSFDSRVLRIIVSSIILSIATGLAFTLYADPFGIMNMIGHLFQVASFYLVYLAFIETSLTKPQDILYQKLKQNEERLAKNVKQLDYANIELKKEIAERKVAEEALRESENRYAMTVAAVNDGLWDWNVQAGSAVFSPLYYSLLGYDDREFSASYASWRLLVHLEDITRIEQELQNSIGNGRGFSIDLRMKMKSGEWLWVCTRGKAVEWDNEGKALRLVGTLSDITDRKRIDAERARLEAENQQLQKAESLGRMAGAIAHYFNNQLGVVMGNLELVPMDLSGNGAIREYLTEAIQAARRSSEMSGLMLTYLGQNTGKNEPLDVSELCRQKLAMLKYAMPEGITLETDLLSSGLVVRANAKEMKQVLTHLITNGWESIGHSVVTVTLTTRIVSASQIPKSHLVPIGWKPETDVFACIEVGDTGCGIAEEDLDKIFDPFFTTKFTGRGLGLAVVLGIVKTWGGAIGVETKKNQGSIFRVFLPLATDKLSLLSVKATEAHPTELGGKVLLVEDLDTMRKIAEAMLKRLGFDVLAASGGAEAVNLLRENPGQIRYVITDLSMPGMDGWETLTALRKIQPDLPVIVVSGYDEAYVRASHYSEQSQIFLQKPYTINDLRAAIVTVLKK